METNEQTTVIPKSIRLRGLESAELTFNPVGSQYKDPNEKSPTYGQIVTRTQASLIYTHGRQRLSLGHADLENFKKIVESAKVIDLFKLLPEEPSIESLIH